jgi:hypothetical protein
MDDANFEKGPRNFFDKIPAPIRPFLIPMIRRKVRRALHGQGFGRHSPEEIATLGTQIVGALTAPTSMAPMCPVEEPSHSIISGPANTTDNDASRWRRTVLDQGSREGLVRQPPRA